MNICGLGWKSIAELTSSKLLRAYCKRKLLFYAAKTIIWINWEFWNSLPDAVVPGYKQTWDLSLRYTWKPEKVDLALLLSGQGQIIFFPEFFTSLRTPLVLPGETGKKSCFSWSFFKPCWSYNLQTSYLPFPIFFWLTVVLEMLQTVS